jgi:hypothetical protein
MNILFIITTPFTHKKSKIMHGNLIILISQYWPKNGSFNNNYIAKLFIILRFLA